MRTAFILQLYVPDLQRWIYSYEPCGILSDYHFTPQNLNPDLSTLCCFDEQVCGNMSSALTSQPLLTGNQTEKKKKKKSCAHQVFALYLTGCLVSACFSWEVSALWLLTNLSVSDLFAKKKQSQTTAIIISATCLCLLCPAAHRPSPSHSPDPHHAVRRLRQHRTLLA